MSPSSTPTTDAGEATPSFATKALTAVPVALTALATVLAGLSSSEMSRSMYYRSLAAQNQAKAGSEWALFQAKRIRGTTFEATSDLVRALSDPQVPDPAQMLTALERVETGLHASGDAVRSKTEAAARNYLATATAAADRVKGVRQKLADLLGKNDAKNALAVLTGSALPEIDERHSKDATLQELVEAVRSRQTEAQTAALVARVTPERLEEAIETSEANAGAFDQACQPIIQAVRQIDELLGRVADEIRQARAQAHSWPEALRPLIDAGDALKESAGGLRVARQDFTVRRYAKEAGYNQEASALCEVLVRRNGYESDRHRERSRNFFYAMLCAQAGVTVASLALARSRMSFFWAVAGIAGSMALAFGVYVYLAM
jgi:hypothetical protein